MKIKYPDYNNSILSVVNSILKHYRAESHHQTLTELDKLLNKNYKNIVLLIFDGLGVNVLEGSLPTNSFFRKNMITELSSVYPSTTTAALTSITSGLTPSEHGWLGWSCYFKEIDKCVDLFSGNLSGIAEGVTADSQKLPNKYLGFENILSQISKSTNDEVRASQVSPFSNYFANTCKGICEHIEELCNEDGNQFIYGYHFQPDYDMHDFGTTAECVKNMVVDFNAQIEGLASKLNDTLFIITADHGMTDITMKCVEDYPQIYECLRCPISMEPRCCSFFIKEEFSEVFSKRFTDEFGDKFELFSHDDFLGMSFLGEGKQHEKVADFIGDYVAVAVSDIALWYKDNHGDFNNFKSSHAGLCSEEMTVPLIVVECTK